MKGFSAPRSCVVKLQHGEDVLDVALTCPPLGYGQFLDLRLKPLPANATEAEKNIRFQRLAFAKLGRALGSQLSATPPADGSGAEGWEAYADSVPAELAAAHLTSGDVEALFAAMTKLEERDKGLDALPKA